MSGRFLQILWGALIVVCPLGRSGAWAEPQEAAPPTYEQLSKSILSAPTLMYDFAAVWVNTKSDGREESAEISGSARFKSPGLARVTFKIQEKGKRDIQEVTIVANKGSAILIQDGRGAEQKIRGSLPEDLRSCLILAGPSFWWMMLGMDPGGEVPLEGPKPLAEFLKVEHADSSRLASGEGKIVYDLKVGENFSANVAVRVTAKEPWLPVERELTMSGDGAKSSMKETYRHVAVGEKIADEIFRIPGK